MSSNENRKREATIAMLERANEEGVARLVTAACVSAASFIAEIDASSADVAAYLEQRFGVALRAMYLRGGRDALERVALDARKLKCR